MAIRLDRERRAASTNRGAARLPPLSPAFLHEADAAYWAHRKIGERRDREYGGVIMKNPAGRYFATEPVPGDAIEFNLLKVLALSPEGYYQQPRGYTCVATYHSHPARHALIQQRNRSFDARMVKAFLGFFSGSDFTHDVDDREFFPAAYLSGPDGSLIRYAPSGSAAERSFALWIKAGKPTGNRVGVYGPFSEFVKKISTLGELSLIVPTSLWGGSIGKVPADWVVFEPFTSKAVTSQPLLTPVFARAEDAVGAALASSMVIPGRRTCGFVLKHSDADRYVATFALEEDLPLFSPQGRFPPMTRSGWALPAQYRLEAIYFRSSPSAADMPARESWLYDAFFTPGEVQAAITQANATLALQHERRGLQLYMQASDGALLKLKVPQTQNAIHAGVLEDTGTQAALADGSLSPRDYVRRVMAATELSVVKAGQLWRDVGPVTARSAVVAVSEAIILKASFLSANDAALHAHEVVGNRRAHYYGGYVLKGVDGGFFISEPRQSSVNAFDGRLFFPLGGAGPLIPPERYEVHGRYGSHPALSMIDRGWVDKRRWTQDEALTNLQAFSPEQIRSIILSRQVGYLSGAKDCLLAYTPTDTSAAPVFDNATGKPAEWVRQLAASGNLRVIEGNPLWGPRSVIGSSWTPHSKYEPRVGPPVYATYGAVFATADQAARDLHARVHGRNLETQDCFAFVLKHQDKAQYIASEVVCVDRANVLFKLNSLFAVAETNEYVFPKGFVLHALFRSQQWAPTGLNSSMGWLTKNFVTPAVMYIALYDSVRRGRDYNKGNNLPIYFSLLEGALLRYVPAPIQIGHGGQVESELEQTTQELTSGQKQARDFVQIWAKRGRLSVVRTSPRWDTLGPVSETWSGYEHITRRRLSPAFANADDAARYVAQMVGQGRKRAYGGVILRLANGLFAATEPLAVPPRGFTLDWIYPDQILAKGLYTVGSTIVARYSSVVEQEVPILLTATQKAIYTSMIPSAVLSSLMLREAHLKREYVIGPRGSVLSYHLSDSAAENQLKNQLTPRNLVRGDNADTVIEQQLRTGTLLPSDFVSQVARAGTLRVIEGSEVWGPSRQITAEFIANVERPAALLIRASLADPACSPIFTRPYDAVRHAQQGYTVGAQPAFGFLLKALNKAQYMVTLPLVRAHYADLKQVFPNGQLPQGYALEGLYLCASNEAIAEPGDDMVYSFQGPQAIANGLNFVNKPVNGRVLPLYLICADGALLRYRLTAPNVLYELMRRAPRDATQLLEGSQRVSEYVLSLVASGELDVRIPSRIWGRSGRVTAQWHSQQSPHGFSSNPYFHSFCGPLFADADDAARFAQKQLGPFAGKEYLGAVLVPPHTPGFVAIEPVEDVDGAQGEQSSLELFFWPNHSGFDLPPSHELYFYTIAALQAFYKAIPSTSSKVPLDIHLLANFVAVQDLRSYVEVLQRNLPAAKSCYLACRGGALLKYMPGFNSQETALLNPSLPSTPSQLVSQLRRFGTLSVLDSDSFWTRRGLLSEKWQFVVVPAEPDEDQVDFGRDKDEL